MLSSGEGVVIIWDNILSSECSVIISRSGGAIVIICGGGCYHPSGMIACSHLRVVLSSQEGGEGECYHLGRGVISSRMITCYHLSVVLSSERGNGILSSVEGGVIIWDDVYCYHPSVVLSSHEEGWGNVIIWGGGCYYLG